VKKDYGQARTALAIGQRCAAGLVCTFHSTKNSLRKRGIAHGSATGSSGIPIQQAI
jgi:hypothetical protein